MRAFHAVAAVVAVILLLVRRRCSVRGIKLQLLSGFGMSDAQELVGADVGGGRGIRQSYRGDPRIHIDHEDIGQQPLDID